MTRVAGAGRALGGASVLVALAACCFGSISILVIVATRAGASLTTVLAWRYLVGAALLLVATGPRGVRRPWREALPTVVIGGIGQALVSFLTLTALRWITAATLAFLFYTYPAWIALLALARGTERVDGRKALSLALSFGGIALMVGAPWAGPVAWPGLALALASAVTYALYVPFLHRAQHATSPAVASVYVTAGAGLLFLVAALGGGTFTARLAPAAWGAVATLAVVCTFAAFLAFLRGLATLGPVRAGIVATVEPFWTAVLGAAVLGQRLTATTLAGGALIAAAVLLLQLRGDERAAAGVPEGI